NLFATTSKQRNFETFFHHMLHEHLLIFGRSTHVRRRRGCLHRSFGGGANSLPREFPSSQLCLGCGGVYRNESHASQINVRLFAGGTFCHRQLHGSARTRIYGGASFERDVSSPGIFSRNFHGDLAHQFPIRERSRVSVLEKIGQRDCPLLFRILSMHFCRQRQHYRSP